MHTNRVARRNLNQPGRLQCRKNSYRGNSREKINNIALLVNNWLSRTVFCKARTEISLFLPWRISRFLCSVTTTQPTTIPRKETSCVVKGLLNFALHSWIMSSFKYLWRLHRHGHYSISDFLTQEGNLGKNITHLLTFCQQNYIMIT